MLTVADLVKTLKKFDQTLPVAFVCTENNLEGKRLVGSAHIAPADFGKLVLLQPE